MMLPTSPVRAEQEEPARLPRFDTWLLVAMAAAALAIVRVESAWHRGSTVALAASEWLIGCLIFALSRNLPAARRHLQKGLNLYVLIAFGAPFLCDLIWRSVSQFAAPLEITILVSVQCAAFMFASMSQHPHANGAAGLLSAVSLLFVSTMSTNRGVHALACAYGVVGLWWLITGYWERLRGTCAASSVARCYPVRGIIVLVAVFVAICVTSLVGASSASTYVLRGFMPSSGGNRWHAPNARSGVGDGDAMVAATDEAMAFGPVDSQLFLDSDMPSLYDMFDDTYGEPPKPKEKQSKSIALAFQERDASEQRIAESQNAGREFSAVRRKAPRRSRHLSDKKSSAVLHLIGESPLHLALEAFEHFDGRVWSQRTRWQGEAEPVIKPRFGKPWVTMRSHKGRMHRGIQCYGLRVINLKTNRIPIPNQLYELHIDKVDRADFFAWTADGMVEMPGQGHVPRFTVIHAHARGVHLYALRTGQDFSESHSSAEAPWLKPFLECSGVHRNVAAQWTRGVPRGWRQIDAIVQRLRSEFRHSPNRPAPEACNDVVAHFLESKEGPDYLFASAAVELLRSLNYPARLVGGFYADPKRLDGHSKQTTVLPEDVHVWAEVCVDGRHWITIEPTPGYQQPKESLDLWQRVTLAFWRWLYWGRRHWPQALSWIALAATVAWLRRPILDAFGWAVCCCFSLGSPRSRLIWTLRLIEWRAWLAGRARLPHRTIRRWYQPIVDAAPGESRSELKSFFDWLDAMLYSQREWELQSGREVRRTCAAVVAQCRRSLLAQSIPDETSDDEY